MARNLQTQLEAEAERKGLHGEHKTAWIGGAWHAITNGGAIGSEDERKHLAAVVGAVHDVRKGHRGAVVFRQGEKWYELPRGEWRNLVRAGREIAREEQKEQRAIAAYEKALAREKDKEKRDQARAVRHAEAEAKAQQRIVRETERAEHAEVLRLIREAGGIRRYSKASHNGKEAERGEYNMLPHHVRARVRRGAWDSAGITMDEAAMKLAHHMPWLRLETGSDLVDYFGRHRDTANVRKLRKAG